MTDTMRDWAIITVIAIVIVVLAFTASNYGADKVENWNATTTTEATS